MGYRDKKNPWHVIFDQFVKDNEDIAGKIKTYHPTIFPIIEIEFDDGTKLVYNGRTKNMLTEEKDKPVNYYVFHLLED